MAKKNAYGFFVDDVTRLRQSRGQRVDRVNLFRELDQEWRGLPEHLKNRYKEYAKTGNFKPPNFLKEDNCYNDELTGKMDLNASSSNIDPDTPAITDSKSLQKPLAKIETKPVSLKRPYEEEREVALPQAYGQTLKKHKPGIPGWMKNDNPATHETARYSDIDMFNCRKQCETLIASKIDRLKSMPVYSFSVNVLCKDFSNQFIPLEITIYAYSLTSGKIGDPYHALIDPGPIPMRCFNISKDHSDIHHITYPFEDRTDPSFARNDYKKLYKEILDYTKCGERTLLVSDAKQMEQARGTIDWIYKKASDDNFSTLPKPSSWSILPMLDFFVAMNNFIRLNKLGQERPEFALHYKMKLLLDKTLLDHNPKIMCLYHQPEDKQTKYCTRSCALRAISYLEPVLERIYNLLEESDSQKAIEGPVFLQLPGPTEDGE